MGSGVSLENGTARQNDFRLDVATDIMGRKRNVRFCFRGGGRPGWDTLAAVMTHHFGREMCSSGLPVNFEMDQVQCHDITAGTWHDTYGSMQRIKNKGQIFVFQPETGHGKDTSRTAIPPSVGEAIVMSVTATQVVLDYTPDFQMHYIFQHVDKAGKKYVLLGEVHALLSASGIESRYEEVSRWFARLNPKASGRLTYHAWVKFGKEHPALVQEVFRFVLEAPLATVQGTQGSQGAKQHSIEGHKGSLNRAIKTSDIASGWALLTDNGARKAFCVKDLKGYLNAGHSPALLQKYQVLRRDPAAELSWEEWWRVCHNEAGIAAAVLAQRPAAGGRGGAAAVGGGVHTRNDRSRSPTAATSPTAVSGDILEVWEYLVKLPPRVAGTGVSLRSQRSGAQRYAARSRFDTSVAMRDIQALLKEAGYKGARNATSALGRRGSETVTWDEWCKLCKMEPQIVQVLKPHGRPSSGSRRSHSNERNLRNRDHTDISAAAVGDVWNSVSRGETVVSTLEVADYLDDNSGWWSGWEADLGGETTRSQGRAMREELLALLAGTDVVTWQTWWAACPKLSTSSSAALVTSAQKKQHILETMAEHVWKVHATPVNGTPLLAPEHIVGSSHRSLTWTEWWRHALSHPLDLNTTYTRSLTSPRRDRPHSSQDERKVWSSLCPVGDVAAKRDLYLLMTRGRGEWRRDVVGALYDDRNPHGEPSGVLTLADFTVFWRQLPQHFRTRLEEECAHPQTHAHIPVDPHHHHLESPRRSHTPPHSHTSLETPKRDQLWNHLTKGATYCHKKDVHTAMTEAGIPWTSGTAGTLYDPAVLDINMNLIGTGGQVARWQFNVFAEEQARVVEHIVAALPSMGQQVGQQRVRSPTRHHARDRHTHTLATNLWGRLRDATQSRDLEVAFLKMVFKELSVRHDVLADIVQGDVDRDRVLDVDEFERFVADNEALCSKLWDAINVGRIDLRVVAEGQRRHTRNASGSHNSVTEDLWQVLARGRDNVYTREVFTLYQTCGIPWTRNTVPTDWFEDGSVETQAYNKTTTTTFLGPGKALQLYDVMQFTERFPQIAGQLLEGTPRTVVTPREHMTANSHTNHNSHSSHNNHTQPHTALSEEVWRSLSGGAASVSQLDVQASFRESGVPWTREMAGPFYDMRFISKRDWDSFTARYQHVVCRLSDSLVRSISFTPGPNQDHHQDTHTTQAPFRSSDADLAWERLCMGKPYVLKREIVVAMQRVEIPWAEETIGELGNGHDSRGGDTPSSPGHVRRKDWDLFAERYPRVVAKLSLPPTSKQDMEFAWRYLTGGGPSEMSTYTALMGLLRKSGVQDTSRVATFFFPSHPQGRSKSDRDPLITHSEWQEFCTLFPRVLQGVCTYVTQL